MAFVTPEHAEIGVHMEVSMLGQRFGATVTEPCLYDSPHARDRAARLFEGFNSHVRPTTG